MSDDPGALADGGTVIYRIRIALARRRWKRLARQHWDFIEHTWPSPGMGHPADGDRPADA
jgi:hypothetical protein